MLRYPRFFFAALVRRPESTKTTLVLVVVQIHSADVSFTPNPGTPLLDVFIVFPPHPSSPFSLPPVPVLLVISVLAPLTRDLSLAQWIRVRSILRPKLAQKLAEEEEARVKAEKSGGVVSGLDEEDHEEDHEETEEDKELKEKEMRDKREKEEKEKKEKEKKLKMEQEKKEKQKQAEAEKTIVAARAVAEEGGSGAPAAAAPPNEAGRADNDDEEEEEDDRFDDEDGDLEDLYKRRLEDMDFDDDPFYGRPWSTEVPKVSRASIRCVRN